MAVARVCYRLDGIPLAIELAAARARVLSAEQISSRLDDSFGLLTGGGRSALAHQRTLRTAMDWSHDLLSSEERAMLRRLSVFAGGFVLEAAEAVGTGEGIEEAGVLDLLGSLADKSLVLALVQDQETRDRLLETVRQYASEKLEQAGEAEEVGRRHARYYLVLAEEAERGSSGMDQAWWLERLETEHDNLRAALGWSLGGGGAELGLGLAAALWSFWYTHGHLSEGRRWLEGAIAADSATTTRARAKALGGAGYIALFQGEYEAARRFLEEGPGSLQRSGRQGGYRLFPHLPRFRRGLGPAGPRDRSGPVRRGRGPRTRPSRPACGGQPSPLLRLDSYKSGRLGAGTSTERRKSGSVSPDRGHTGHGALPE